MRPPTPLQVAVACVVGLLLYRQLGLWRDFLLFGSFARETDGSDARSSTSSRAIRRNEKNASSASGTSSISVNSPRPSTLEESVCEASPLLQRYLKRHARVTSHPRFPDFLYDDNKEKDQVLVYLGFPPPPLVGRHTGIADRFTGLITLFSLCVATDTVLLIDWPQLETVLEPSHRLREHSSGTPPLLFVDVNNVSREYRSPRIQHLLQHQFSSPETKALPNFFRYPIQYQRGLYVLETLRNRTFGADFGNVYFARAIHGNIAEVLQTSPYFHDVMVTKGKLSLDTIYGCLFNLLFDLRVKALTPGLKKLYDDFVAIRDVPKILIQIRSGDTAITESKTMLNITDEEVLRAEIPKSYTNFFKCGEFLSRGKKDVVWYVMSDNVLLKRLALLKYGGRGVKVVTHLGATTHSGWLYYMNHTEGLMNSVVEWYLAGMCDYFIITSSSGLGNQASFRSLHPRHTTYVLPLPVDFAGEVQKRDKRKNASPIIEDTQEITEDQCRASLTSPENIARSYSEIR